MDVHPVDGQWLQVQVKKGTKDLPMGHAARGEAPSSPPPPTPTPTHTQAGACGTGQHIAPT